MGWQTGGAAKVTALAAALGGMGCADASTTSTASTASTTSTTSTTSTSGDTTATRSTSSTVADESSTPETSASSDTTTHGSTTTGEPVMPQVILPRHGIAVDELGVLVNDADPQSVAVAEYYVAARGIPEANVVHLSLPVVATLGVEAFATAAATVEAAMPPSVQALAITWTQPYRVDCMSVTSAFALGVSTDFCSTPCNPTAEVAMFDSPTTMPYTEHFIRPTMMLAGDDLAEIQALIDRGVASDGTRPFGDGYLVRTTDEARSVRFLDFMDTVDLFDHDGGLAMTYIDNSDGAGLDYIEATRDVMFYFTGLVSVPEIASNTYLPGAMADHLTSYGGEVPVSSQMSIVQWLKAGATGSYGTVVEPCNFTAKFPQTSIAVSHYFRGQTLVEAYWKSVRTPGEGLFVGEPLARPWAGAEITFEGGVLVIRTTLLEPGVAYDVQAGPTADGPWDTVFTGQVPYPVDIAIEIPDATAAYYRLQPVP
jgi:uncharacterized protein (TIGR03790 family)